MAAVHTAQRWLTLHTRVGMCVCTPKSIQHTNPRACRGVAWRVWVVCVAWREVTCVWVVFLTWRVCAWREVTCACGVRGVCAWREWVVCVRGVTCVGGTLDRHEIATQTTRSQHSHFTHTSTKHILTQQRMICTIPSTHTMILTLTPYLYSARRNIHSFTWDADNLTCLLK